MCNDELYALSTTDERASSDVPDYMTETFPYTSPTSGLEIHDEYVRYVKNFLLQLRLGFVGLPNVLSVYSMFRVISAEEYLANFASDRSHMVHISLASWLVSHSHLIMFVKIRTLEDGTIHYVSPPPTYEAVCGPRALAQGIKNNLMSSFVSMRSQSRTSVSQEKGADVTKTSTVEDGGEIEGPKCKLGERGKENCGYGVVMKMSNFLSWLSS